MVSPIVHFQLVSPDPEATGAFVREAFGWDLTPGAGPIAANIDTGWADDIRVAGSLRRGPDGAPAQAQVFVRLDDMPGAIERAKGLGAEVIVPATDTPNGPTVAVIRAPDGIIYGLVQQ